MNAEAQESFTLCAYDEQKSGFVLSRNIPKPWGYEELIVVTDRYVMKQLVIKKGESLSKQYHKKKMETLLVATGSCLLLLGEEGDLDLNHATKHLFEEGDVIHLNPNTIHSFEALQDTVLYEVSTPELDDVVRLGDKYNRV